ncbi:hypothetical protein [uncultured Desulfovibrio sp.]|uniref:hypothetical protein n=1 Tax=uncultured Desulfovibrio sp. TaxID=167968 RepID=UPI00262EA27B|nr:hypothetical protein [uncultured Desulfovibrio sp.]
MLKMSLIHALAALMLMFVMTGTAHAASRRDEAPISVRETTDSPEKLAAAGYELVITSNKKHAAKVLITAEKPLKNFRIVAIRYVPNDDPDNMTIRFQELGTLHARNMLMPDTPLCAVVEMIGSIPNIGFSYTAEDGRNLLFSLNYSGQDGSLFLSAEQIANK